MAPGGIVKSGQPTSSRVARGPCQPAAEHSPPRRMCQEGDGEATYQIGVHDNGTPEGLPPAELGQVRPGSRIPICNPPHSNNGGHGGHLRADRASSPPDRRTPTCGEHLHPLGIAAHTTRPSSGYPARAANPASHGIGGLWCQSIATLRRMAARLSADCSVRRRCQGLVRHRRAAHAYVATLWHVHPPTHPPTHSRG
jgi:hypothetical protein